MGWAGGSTALLTALSFVDLCSRPVLISSQLEWRQKTKRDEKYTKTSRFSHSNVCASVPIGPLPRPGPQSWRSFRSRWRKKTSVLSNWSTLLTGICHWLAWMSRSLDRSSSQTQMRRTTERGMSHPNTTIYTINIIYFFCLRQFPWKENVWETVSACCTKCLMYNYELQLRQSIIFLGTEKNCCHSPHCLLLHTVITPAYWIAPPFLLESKGGGYLTMNLLASIC